MENGGAHKLYYYAVSSIGSDYQYIHLFPQEASKEFLFEFARGDFKREAYQRKIFDYDFIIWSDRLQVYRADLLNLYQNNSKLIKVAEFKKVKNQLTFVDKILKLLHVQLYDSYNCVIYKRINSKKNITEKLNLNNKSFYEK